MRILLLAAVLTLSACATLAAQADQVPIWRRDTMSLERDTQIARNCVLNNSESCDQIIQDECTGGDGGEGITPSVLRVCDWRAIAAWEDVSAQMLTELRERLDGRNLANLEASQTAFETSMLADVTAAMDLYEGGSLQGAVGAQVRAHAMSHRAQYLTDLMRQIGEDE